ncbi:uncharacterized protein LOC122461465 [Chelonia mydas]|uniref:uncharacterized protein LOC122461465 n=1 Tax=Chelonia mydas TaxID=8469 RepID=UPI001CA92D79|nr:uncharacterized protein LOC122461465 [Chelonia mydas]
MHTLATQRKPFKPQPPRQCQYQPHRRHEPYRRRGRDIRRQHNNNGNNNAPGQNQGQHKPPPGTKPGFGRCTRGQRTRPVTGSVPLFPEPPVPFLPCMVHHYIRPLGLTHGAERVLAAVCLPPPLPAPFPVPLQGPLSRASPRGGGLLAATGWGGRGGAAQPKGEGVPVLPHPQGQRGPSPHPRPARAKQIPVKARFLMVSLSTIIPSLGPGDWYATLDMKDAYFHIAIFPAHRWFLRFTVGREHYQFAVLPFGLAAAARVFTKCMAVVAAFLQRQRIRVYPYLDDWLLVGQSKVEVWGHVEVVLRGLSVSPPNGGVVP